MVDDMNALDDQHLSLFSNFTDRLRSQLPLTCRYIARLQRAAQGAGQSTGRGGYHVVQRGSMGLVDILIDAVVLGDAADTPVAVPHNIVLTPNGKKIYVTHSGPNSVVTVYTATRQDAVPEYLTTVEVGDNPFGLAFVP